MKPNTNLSLLALAGWLSISASYAIDVSFEEDHSLPVVNINVAVKAGSVTDPELQSGVSEFMGEMLRRGTRSKSKEQIDLALDQMGARIGIETRAESMILRGAVLASQLDHFLALLDEIITQPSFPEVEIRKLKAETLSEILDELGEDSTLNARRFNEFLFQGHPYGKPINGRTPDVQAFNRAKVVAHYSHYVHDKNLLVIGQGDAPQERIQSWAESLSKKLPTGARPVVSDVPPPQDAQQRRLQITDKPDRTQTWISLGQIGIKMTDADFFPLWLGNHIFGGHSFSSRLYQDIRLKHSWSYGASSGFRFGRQPRQWKAYLFPAAPVTADALAETLKLIAQLRETGVTQEEFTFAQSSLIASSGFMYNTPDKRVENTLLEKTLGLPNGLLKSYGVELAKVTVAQVNAALKHFLAPDKLAISVVGTASQLKEALAKAAGVPSERVVVQPYPQE